MSSYRPIDSKREEFRKYLEKAGALDALTKVLVMLYDEPEKPADALDYIRKHLGDKTDEAEMETIKSDLNAAYIKIQSMDDEITMLKERLAKYEPDLFKHSVKARAASIVDSTDPEKLPDLASGIEARGVDSKDPEKLPNRTDSVEVGGVDSRDPDKLPDPNSEAGK